MMGLSRRHFLKGAGLTGALAAAGPGLLVTSANKARVEVAVRGRPSWVREVEEPTIEIDWDRMKRFDERTTCRGGFPGYVGKEEYDRLTVVQTENAKRRLLEAVPGYALKDLALQAGSGAGAVGRSFLGPRKALTPEKRGVPKWEGSPQEAARIVRAALRHLGAASVGFVELNERTRKLIYAVDPDGKAIEFEDVDDASETKEKRVIPIRARWVVAYTVQMSEETLKRAPTVLGAQTTNLTYTRGQNIQERLQEFLWALGYLGLGEASTNALGIAPAFGVLAGLGELSRLNRLVTPEYGPMVRVFKLVTDLPLAPDRPIDAGIAEFCKRCKRCAEECPSRALSMETEPTWDVKGPWNNPGHKTWFEDSVKCRSHWMAGPGTNCGICFSVCPFAKKDKALVHQIVRATAAATSVFDSLFVAMDQAFGYGTQKDQEAWWDLDLPEYGIDTMQGKENA